MDLGHKSTVLLSSIFHDCSTTCSEIEKYAPLKDPKSGDRNQLKRNATAPSSPKKHPKLSFPTATCSLPTKPKASRKALPCEVMKRGKDLVRSGLAIRPHVHHPCEGVDASRQEILNGNWNVGMKLRDAFVRADFHFRFK